MIIGVKGLYGIKLSIKRGLGFLKGICKTL